VMYFLCPPLNLQVSGPLLGQLFFSMSYQMHCKGRVSLCSLQALRLFVIGNSDAVPICDSLSFQMRS
jgi:hypothetical protein